MNREELIKAAEAKYTISSLPWLKEREHKAIAHGVDAVLAAGRESVDEIKELKWQKTTLQAELGQEHHVRQRLEEELGYVREALAEAGLHYNENYGRPIRELIARAERNREPEPVQITDEMRASARRETLRAAGRSDNIAFWAIDTYEHALAAALSALEGER